MYDDLFTRLTAVEQPMLHCVNEENQYLPGEYEVAHNTGRWWEAALQLAATTGMKIPARMDRAMSLNLRAMASNPYGLLLQDPEVFGGGALNYHNLREALLAYTSLIEFRNSRWARNSAEKLLDTINRRFFEKTLTDEEICKTVGVTISGDTMLTRPTEDRFHDDDDTPTTGRAIEGMYRYWLVTGSPLALQVMRKAVVFHRAHSLCPDGSTPAWMMDDFHTGHNHSYLGTIRGLLLYALHFDDKALLKSIYLTYKNSIPVYNCDETGFAPHDLGLARFPDRFGDPFGDQASCADTVYIAFLLAVQGGHPELLSDVERLIRARLFFCQITSGSACGAWGTFGEYFGQNSTIDVFALIAVTLCRIYQDMIAEKNDGLYVYLHFSSKNALADVEVTREKYQLTRITPHIQKRILVHIPEWVPADSIRVIDTEGKAVTFEREGVYLVIPEVAVVVEKTLEVSFALPRYETTAQTWVTKKQFHLQWKGDTLLEAREM